MYFRRSSVCVVSTCLWHIAPSDALMTSVETLSLCLESISDEFQFDCNFRRTQKERVKERERGGNSWHKWQRFHMVAVSQYLNGITNANIWVSKLVTVVNDYANVGRIILEQIRTDSICIRFHSVPLLLLLLLLLECYLCVCISHGQVFKF